MESLLSWVSAYFWPLLVYLAFAVPPLAALRSRPLDDTTRALWALVITVPIGGAIAFAIVQPGARTS